MNNERTCAIGDGPTVGIPERLALGAVRLIAVPFLVLGIALWGTCFAAVALVHSITLASQSGSKLLTGRRSRSFP